MPECIDPFIGQVDASCLSQSVYNVAFRAAGEVAAVLRRSFPDTRSTSWSTRTVRASSIRGRWMSIAQRRSPTGATSHVGRSKKHSMSTWCLPSATTTHRPEEFT